MSLIIITIVAMLIWIMVSLETVKPSEKINWRKTILLMTTGSLLTMVSMISFFQDIPFLQ